jgi:adenine-specific DNA-methyltransferase
MPRPGKKIRLGQYYTSPEVAELLLSLAEAKRSARVLEPSFGEGVFLKTLLQAGYRDITAYDIDKKNYKMVLGNFGEEVSLYNKSFLSAPREENYDLIIGNPPYVRWSNIDKATKEFLRNDSFWKQYSSGEWDLLYAFILWSAELLTRGGELLFIVPYNWFTATHAASLRHYLLQEGHLTDIIHFSEYKVFRDASPNAIIFRWKKDKISSLIRTVELQTRSKDSGEVVSQAKAYQQKLLRGEEGKNKDWKYFLAQQPKDKRPWYLITRQEARFVERVERGSPPLSKAAQVGVGLVSGCNEAFILQDSLANIGQSPLIKDFIKAKNCQRSFISGSTKFIFANHITSENELEKFPEIYNHLLSYRQRLLERWGVKEDTWWHWATVRNLDLFQKNLHREKIFVPCTDRSPLARFALTKKPCLGSGDVLLLVPKGDPYYLQAWLASKTFSTWYRLRGPRAGQRIKYTQAFLAGAPFLPQERLLQADLSRLLSNTRTLLRSSTSRDKREELLAENDDLFARSLG